MFASSYLIVLIFLSSSHIIKGSLDPIDFSGWIVSEAESPVPRTNIVIPISPDPKEKFSHSDTNRKSPYPQSPDIGDTIDINQKVPSSENAEFSVKSQDLSGDYIASYCKCANYCPPEGTRIAAGIRNERAVNTPSCRSGQFMCCLPPKPGCGIVEKFPSFHPYPAFGEANYGEYPWTALVLDLNTRVLGTGVIISPTSVLTTARNVMPYLGRRLKVRLGEWDLGSDVEPFVAQEYIVTEVRVHPEFNDRTFQNDLCILRLNGSIPFNKYPHLRPACVGRPGDLYKFNNANCLSAGWAFDSTNSRIVSTNRNLLKEVDLQMLSPSVCQQAIRRASKNPEYYWDEAAFICAGGLSSKGLCKGDEGTGLICQDRPDSPFVLTGISSWGTSCGEQGFPGVFTNIGTYYTWIKSIDPYVQYA